ncbi:MAG: ATP-binding cassette domain-containing protein [Egibacteraceae bacterium]
MTARAVTVRDLHKRYGEVVALDGVDFDIEAGSVLGLLGPNGSGKTTTVGILSTALLPDRGHAHVCGLDVVRDAAGVRSTIGFAGQSAAIDANLTGRENLVLVARLSRVPRRSARGRADELLERFDLTGAAGRLVRTYSGGMRRRLDVAAALVHRPPVLFLDEPTTGLDPPSRLALWEMVRELVRDGATALLTTQYLEEADSLADMIVVLDRGRVIERGTPSQLKRRLGSVVVELTFQGDGSAARAERALTDHAFDVERTAAVVRLSSAKGSAVVIDALRALDKTAPDPVAVAIRQPTLDDVFLALTGHKRGAA